MSYIVLVKHEGQQKIYKVPLSSNHSITVGRGWESDVLINDGYIDSEHLSFSISDEGEVSVTDLSTTNGTLYKKKYVSKDQEYDLGYELIIGESIISLVKAEAPVPPAIKRDIAQKASRKFGSWLWVAVASTIAALSIYGMQLWLTSEESTNESITRVFSYSFLVMLGWVAAAGYVDNIFKKKMFIKLHWIYLCSVIVLSSVLVVLTDIARFNTNSYSVDQNIQKALFLFVVLTTVYGFLTISTRMRSVKKSVIASLVAILPLVAYLSSTMFMEEHEYWTNDAHVKLISPPPALMFRNPVSVEDHLNKTDGLFAYLDSVTGFDEVEEDVYESSPNDYSDPVVITESTNDGM